MEVCAPKVSVITTTYNQEAYIAQTIESVLAQQCDFDYEYIIADDKSTDRTPEILQEYQKKYPNTMRVILREENLGAQRNFAKSLWESRGQYVALLDGDDFWTSPRKLQKQADFLDEHSDCALCFHGATTLLPDGHSYIAETSNGTSPPERSTIEDLLQENFISACTVMYRWGLVESLPSWWYDMWIGDYPLHVMHAQKGWIGYIDEIMAAYRLHGEGVWSGREISARVDGFVNTLRHLDHDMGFRYHEAIEKSVFSHMIHAAVALKESGDTHLAKPYFIWCLWHIRYRGSIPSKVLIVLALEEVSPWLIRVVVKAKSLLRRLVRSNQSEATSDSRRLR